MKERSLPKLLVFVPPRRSLGAKGQLSSGSVVNFVAPGPGGSSGETPITLLPKAAALDLVFDPANVFVTAIEPPKLSEGKLRLALPNMLEDRLLAAATDCHFAFSVPRGGTGSTTIAALPKMPVAVIDRGLLTRALDACAEAGFRVRAAYSEIYTVPAPAAGLLSVRVRSRSRRRTVRDARRVHVRTGHWFFRLYERDFYFMIEKISGKTELVALKTRISISQNLFNL